METVVLRYFNIFGPGQDPTSEYSAVVPRFITAAIHGKPPTVYGDGKQSRDFTYVETVVLANLLAADPKASSGLTLNVGCGKQYSILDLIDVIGRALGVRMEPVFGPGRVGDVPHSLADISLAQQQLGYHVVVPFEEGIRRTAEWYAERNRQ